MGFGPQQRKVDFGQEADYCEKDEVEDDEGFSSALDLEVGWVLMGEQDACG